MTQLLQSTRDYLKTSTRLGRRMSQYNDEDSSDTNSIRKIDPNAPPQRSATQNRLSGLFKIDSRKQLDENSRMVQQGTVQSDVPSLNRRNSISNNSNSNSNSSIHLKDNSTRIRQSARSRTNGRQEGSAHMENEVPRGRSPANTVSTAASSYDTRPSDYPTMRQYQSHVWRRNLLEESIMHSLRLGYAERNKSASRHRSRSKKDSVRARKAREQAMLSAALGQGLESPVPVSTTSTPLYNLHTSQEDMTTRVIHRAITPPTATPTTPTTCTPTLSPATSTTTSTTVITPRQIQAPTTPTSVSLPQSVPGNTTPVFVQTQKSSNSPYQAHDNASMTNITQSFASFTLELPETHVSNIMASSAVPDMFKIKPVATTTQGNGQVVSRATNSSTTKDQAYRDSRTRMLAAGHGPSPRVLTGKKTADVSNNGLDSPTSLTSPVSPTTAAWMHSVFSSLDQPASLQKESFNA
ncbi:hypothetical protein BGZ94_008636 [Podila epigama]|nr:hypothetical protein BGZ94_008636 [Podila epigama]